MSSSDEDFSDDDEFVDPGLVDSNVVTKYKEAAKVANAAIVDLKAKCVVGASVLELCKAGDQFVTDAVAGMYNKKVDGKIMPKGVGSPCCISLNNCVCSNCPMEGDTVVLAAGDVVKIDLACHIDGYIGAVAGTTVVGASDDAPVEGKAAEVIAACYTGAEAMLRLVHKDKKNTDIPAVLETIAKAYGCSVVEGVISHQMKRYMIDGEKCVLAKVDTDNKVDEHTFEENEVYHIDVAMSTGDGKTKELDDKERSVYKLSPDEMYSLKMKASRMLLSEIKDKYPSLPFTMRSFTDSRAKLGMTELMKHDLVCPYPVLYEKEGEIVAHVKYTVLLMGEYTNKITEAASPPMAPDGELTDEAVLALLAEPVGKPKKPNKKKKKKAAAGGGGGA